MPIQGSPFTGAHFPPSSQTRQANEEKRTRQADAPPKPESGNNAASTAPTKAPTTAPTTAPPPYHRRLARKALAAPAPGLPPRSG